MTIQRLTPEEIKEMRTFAKSLSVPTRLRVIHCLDEIERLQKGIIAMNAALATDEDEIARLESRLAAQSKLLSEADQALKYCGIAVTHRESDCTRFTPLPDGGFADSLFCTKCTAIDLIDQTRTKLTAYQKHQAEEGKE